MENYISETASVLLANIENRQELVQPLIEELVKAGIRSTKTLTFVASGSSYNAILSAQRFVSRQLMQDVRLISPFEFCYYEEIDESIIYLFVSGQDRILGEVEGMVYQVGI